MTAIVSTLALATAGAGVIAFAVAILVSRHWRDGLRMALDLWLAAGLLRLSGDFDWNVIAAAVAVIAIRQLVASRLRRSPVAPAR